MDETRVEFLSSFKFTGKTVKISNLPIIIGKFGKNDAMRHWMADYS